MRFNRKRIIECLFQKINRTNKSVVNNKNNNHNNHKKMDNIIIELGHYQEKTSIGKEKAEIIKIIGPAKDREGYWLTLDGKKIPEYILVEDYVRLDVAPTKQGFKKPKSKLFNDFEPIVEEEQIAQEEKSVSKKEITIIDEIKSDNIYPATNNAVLKLEPEHEYKSILDKLNFKNINTESIRKFGTPLTKNKETILLEVSIDIGFDISKLKQSINLLGLDVTKVADYVLKEINTTDITNLLNKKLIQILSVEDTIVETKKEPIIEPEPIVETKKEPIIEPEPIVQEKLESKIDLTEEISEIDKYISSFLNT